MVGYLGKMNIALTDHAWMWLNTSNGIHMFSVWEDHTLVHDWFVSICTAFLLTSSQTVLYKAVLNSARGQKINNY
jgi:hypothetical protein